MNKYFQELCVKGKERVKDKKIIFCGCIRNNASELHSNIPILEKICSYFLDYRIIIVENNSKDRSKEILKEWAINNNRIIPLMYDFDESKYEDHKTPDEYHPSFVYKRIIKLVDYRNIYMDYISNQLNFDSDYITVIDYDLSDINIDGFFTSFGCDFEWDAVTANGYSYSPKLKRRFHDTYPLFEVGMPFVDSLYKIRTYQEIFAPLRKGMPFIRVASAYNGIAIFKDSVRRNLHYQLIFNNNGGVEVLNDHVSIFKQMIEQGHDKIYINPNMELYYQRVSWQLIKRVIRRWWNNKHIEL